jgi:hypothetical protein
MSIGLGRFLPYDEKPDFLKQFLAKDLLGVSIFIAENLADGFPLFEPSFAKDYD